MLLTFKGSECRIARRGAMMTRHDDCKHYLPIFGKLVKKHVMTLYQLKYEIQAQQTATLSTCRSNSLQSEDWNALVLIYDNLYWDLRLWNDWWEQHWLTLPLTKPGYHSLVCLKSCSSNSDVKQKPKVHPDSSDTGRLNLSYRTLRVLYLEQNAVESL